jgi:hypothetical protein
MGMGHGIITIHKSSFSWLFPPLAWFCLNFADCECFGSSDILVTLSDYNPRVRDFAMIAGASCQKHVNHDI